MDCPRDRNLVLPLNDFVAHTFESMLLELADIPEGKKSLLDQIVHEG